MWATENRQAYARDGLHYPSDLTDVKWVLIANCSQSLLTPMRRQAIHGGSKKPKLHDRTVQLGLEPPLFRADLVDVVVSLENPLKEMPLWRIVELLDQVMESPFIRVDLLIGSFR